MYLGDDGGKEFVIPCDQIISLIRVNGLETASSLLKGRGRGEKPCDTDTGNEHSVRGLTFYH